MAHERRQALLIIDAFSDFNFPDGEALSAALLRVAPTIAATAAACRRMRRPVVYCNDNFGRWHESWETILESTAREGTGASAELFARLCPRPGDIVLLKSRHSAFFHTQLPSLVQDLKIRSVALAGVATDACILCSAIDAHVRDLDAQVLSDATAAASTVRHERALLQLHEGMALGVQTHAAWLEHATSHNGA
jgi:nicotinamidase-related amidase